MDTFDEEIIKFWKAIEDNAVRYLIVEGYATTYMAIKDILAIWISSSWIQSKTGVIWEKDFGKREWKIIL